jgi:hypothetical protein
MNKMFTTMFDCIASHMEGLEERKPKRELELHAEYEELDKEYRRLLSSGASQELWRDYNRRKDINRKKQEAYYYGS